MTRRLALAATAALLAAACGPVKKSYVRPDYEAVDRQQVKRLVVLTQPLPAGLPQVGELWSLIARQWVNQNRDFLVRSNLALPGAPEDATFRALCIEGLEGVLWLEPDVQRVGDSVQAALRARLLRCSDGEDIWRAEAAGSWDSQDELFRERTAQYVQELGPEVEPFVAPTYQLLQATLATLPNPQLTEADIEEKIELGE